MKQAFSFLPARRKLMAAAMLALGGAIATTAPHAFAQDGSYPNRPVTLVVSAAAGGTTDLAARMISEPLAKALGQAVVVDNRPGGNGGLQKLTSTDGLIHGELSGKTSFCPSSKG